MDDEDDRMERIARLAAERGMRIAVAESLTSGRLASTIGAGPQAGDWFAGGVVAYRIETKERVLGVRPGIDPCSAECAVQLAEGVRALLGADVAVSATGVGGPDPQDGHAPGTVHLGWADAGGSGSVEAAFDGEPTEVLDRTVDAALGLILERLGAA